VIKSNNKYLVDSVKRSELVPIQEITANWKTYRNEKYGFEIKYPSEWEVLINDPYGKANPSFRDKKYEGSWEWPGLNIDWPPISGLEIPEIEKKIFELEDTKDEVITTSFTEGGKKIVAICKLYLEPKVLDICNQMLSTFRFIEEIKIGKVEIDYEEIKRIQQSVDEGHQPWRLNPVMVVMSEAWRYGFTEEDIKTIYAPHIDPQWVLGKDITALPVEITHKGKKYEIMVIQPFPGEGKIWTISEIKSKE
jgi:hypothetical protein